MDRRREDDLLALLAAACVGLALVFTKISAEVLQGEHAELDHAVRRFTMSHQYGAVTAFFRAISTIGEKEILVPLTMVAGWFLSRRDKLLFVLLVVFGFIAAEFVDVLKQEFRIGRPLTGMRFSRSYSFPSGHSSGTATLVTLLSYVAWRQNTARILVLTASGVLVLLMAASRVYLDRHWISDVVGGAVIGVALGLACCALYELIERRLQRRRLRAEESVSSTVSSP
jgi:membrane-associated phospholipid phosphatase